MKEFLLVFERIVRAIALCIITYFLILASAYVFIFEGYDSLDYHIYQLFYDFGFTTHHLDGTSSFSNPIYDDIFRVSFSYILIASIYRFARYRKFVWSDLFKRENYYSAVWDKHGHYVLIIFCVGIIFTALLLVYLEIYPACTFTEVPC